MRTPSEVLTSRVEAGDIPSAAWIAGQGEGAEESGAVGWACLEPVKVPATEETLYDLASLTKPLITSFLALLLARLEGIDLHRPARALLPEFNREDKKNITLFQLLTHTSGLKDWAPLYARGRSIEEYVFQIGMMPPESRPGAAVRYSDLGYIALGAALQRAATAPLDRLAAGLILEPLGSGALFSPGSGLLPRVAATEASCNYERRKAGEAARGYQGWRQGVIRGEVHDQNAWAAGGVAGHAGLFGTARDVLAIARELTGRRSTLLSRRDLALVGRIQTGSLGPPRTAAWRVNTGPGGGVDPGTAAGEALSPGAMGHNGFTGTSVWIEPHAGRIHVLLTNRVHPEIREEMDMNALRREFHRASSGA